MKARSIVIAVTLLLVGGLRVQAWAIINGALDTDHPQRWSYRCGRRSGRIRREGWRLLERVVTRGFRSPSLPTS